MDDDTLMEDASVAAAKQAAEDAKDRETWREFEIKARRQRDPTFAQSKDAEGRYKKELDNAWASLPAFRFDFVEHVRDMQKAQEHLEAEEKALDGATDFVNTRELHSIDFASLCKRGTILDFLERRDAVEAAQNRLLAALDAFDLNNPATYLYGNFCRPYLAGLRAKVQGENTGWRDFTDRARPTRADHDILLQGIEDLRRRGIEASLGRELGSCWVGVWELGRGSNGRATLWLKQDPDGVITNRVVVKDSHFTRMKHVWDDLNLWWTETPEGQRVPNEVKALYALRDLPGGDTVTRIINWRIQEKALAFRMYMEYLPFGDALDLTKQHKGGLRRGHRLKWIPEPFIWHAFENLATAGQLMEHGGLTPGQNQTWTPIIHRDMKTANVLLGEPSNDRYRKYPQVKLADFGFALFMPANDTRDPTSIYPLGTPGTRAPEQDHHILNNETQLRRLSEKTNVFGVGITIAMLIKLDNGENYRATGKHWASTPRWSDEIENQYSESLLRLVTQCMSYDPDRRPTFTTVLAKVRRHTSGGFDEEARGLWNADTGDRGWLMNALNLTVTDKYALWARLDELPPPFDEDKWPAPPTEKDYDDDVNGDIMEGREAGTEIDISE